MLYLIFSNFKMETEVGNNLFFPNNELEIDHRDTVI